MEFSEIQDKVMQNAKRYGEACGIEIDEDFAILKLYEEVGELAQATLIHKKKSRPEKFLPFLESKEQMALEMADVLGLLIVNAKLHNIDLEDAINKKWISRLKEA
ncbi:MAG: MazG nucleotide pyrophosphohydrolase domain-containing protein [bacterium]|nr:MazG nucleotide pyrophosphohydrolase domain-containing protein [bacterium]